MRVLQIISSVSDAHGGGSTAVWATLKALQSRNVHSELATTNEDGHGRVMDVPVDEFTPLRGHRVRFFPNRGDRYVTSWPMARWLFAHVRDYDLLHIHGLFRFAPIAAAHAALARGVPYVLTLHNILGQWGMHNRRPLLKRLSIGLIEGRVIDGAGRVHLCSFNELEQALRVRSFDGRASVFPLGLDLSDEAPRSGAEAVPAGPDMFAGHPVVLYMSRIHEIKGVDKLLTAFAEIRRMRPDAVLVIAGNGEERLIAQLQELARQLGIADRTHWAGYVQGQRKQELLSQATVFVLPSHSENFGYAVVEAIAAGVPVVTSVNVPAGKFVAEADGGIIYDGTTEQLTQAILQILDMPEEKRRALGPRAAAEVRERLSLRRYGESLEAIYREIVTPRERGQRRRQ
jgi:glycosyltransferase involved in cell wall biosynthesis